MSEQASRHPWLFDEFRPGAELGLVGIDLDAQRARNWSAIYGPLGADEMAPAGMLVAAMMEAYLKVFQPRPPGNIHAGQKLTFAPARSSSVRAWM